MSNFATAFKNEISRITRKELKQVVDPMRRQLASQRKEIAALKRERDQLQRAVAALSRAGERTMAARVRATPADADAAGLRFSAAGLGKLRQRLGLSAGDFAQLAGVSGQTVYNWEHGRSRPRAAQLQQIAALRGLGKREVARRLAQSGD